MKNNKNIEIANAKRNSLYEYRIKNWLKLDEVAEELNNLCEKRGIDAKISKVHIYYWENGLRTPRDKNIVKAIADLIGIKSKYLIEEFKF